MPGAPQDTSAQPLSRLLHGSVLGDSVSPPIWGESRASGGLHAAASSPQDGGSPNGPRGDPAHFIQDTSGGFCPTSWGAAGFGAATPELLCSICLPLLQYFTQNCVATGKTDQEPRGSRGWCCSWGVQAGYQSGVKVRSWGSSALLTSVLGMQLGREHQQEAQISQVRAVGTARLCLPNLRAQLTAGQLGRGAYKRGKVSPALYQHVHGLHLPPKMSFW